MHSTDDRLRMNYLSKLGVIDPKDMMLKRRNSDDSTSSTISTTFKKKMMHVRFDDSAIEVHEVESRADFDAVTKLSYWYNDYELEEIASVCALEDYYEKLYGPADEQVLQQAEAMVHSATANAAYLKENQMYVFPQNKGMAIRNVGLRPPRARQNATLWCYS